MVLSRFRIDPESPVERVAVQARSNPSQLPIIQGGSAPDAFRHNEPSGETSRGNRCPAKAFLKVLHEPVGLRSCNVGDMHAGFGFPLTRPYDPICKCSEF